MTRPMRTSRQGLDLIKSFEGFRARATPLGSGRWIIGYGHTQTAREGLKISERDAAAVLQHHDLLPVEAALARLILAPVHQNQFDALVSFAFNLGIEVFRSTDVLAHLNAGEPLKAACAMGAWRKARVNGRLITVDALVRRRAVERALFLESPYGRPVAPSPMVRPERDTPGEEPPLVETPQTLDVSGPVPAIVDPDPATGSTSPPSRPPSAGRTSEEAARRIGEKVTRILGENSDPPPGGKVPSYGPEDITAAIAAIADPQPGTETGEKASGAAEAEAEAEAEAGSEAKATNGETDDHLPPPPEPGTPPETVPIGIVIDDLEPAVPVEPEASGREPVDTARLAAFALAALLGGLVAASGVRQVGRVASGEAAFTDPWQVLIGPFAVVLGTVLAALMVYAGLRTLLRR